MDPLSAIGLVSSVITFIDFGYEVISAAGEVRSSASGATRANQHVEFLNTRMEAVAKDLAVVKSSRGMSADTKRLTELADKCLEFSNDLKKLLDKLRVDNSKSKRQVFSAIVQNVRKKDQKKDLETKLDQCRQQLHLQLSHTTRLETLSRLDEIAQTGRCQEKELGSLNQQLVILKDVVAALNPNSKVQDAALTVLNLSDMAVSKVLQNRILEALKFEKMESRFDSIEEAHTETFKWLLEDETSSALAIPTGDTNDPWFISMVGPLNKDIPLRLEIRKDFTNWLTCGNGIFHISGKPGAGKSTLMKYIAESDEVRKHLDTWAGEKELTFASFFFWRHGTEFQKSLQGLLRSLLYSVLEQHPDLAQMVFPIQWDVASKSPGKTLHFRRSEIQNAFRILTETPEVHLKHKFAFFVDGLDEFEGHDDALVKTLFEWARSGSDNIKICVSSRELPLFQQRFSKCLKFRLHEVTYHDIFLFVYDTLRDNEDVKSMSNPQDIALLGQILVRRAEGVFLWVSLALRLVERGLLLEESIEELKRSIKVLPSELEQLFRVMFDSIKTEPDDSKRRRAMRTLSLALDTVQVPATDNRQLFTRLSFLDDYDRNPEFSNHIEGDINPTSRNLRLSRCRKQIEGGCKGLLRIRHGRHSRNSPAELAAVRKDSVALAHRSLVEFFQLPDVRACIEEHLQGFDKVNFYGQSLIAEVKVWLLGQDLPLHSQWLVFDFIRFICLYHYIRDPHTSALFSTIAQLRKLIQANPQSPWKFNILSCISRWHWSGSETSPARPPVQYTPEEGLILVAVEYGLHELWPAENMHENLHETILHAITLSLEMSFAGDVSIDASWYPPFHRSLRGLAICLADGTPPNSLMPVDDYRVTVSVWQNLVWHSILTISPRECAVPVWLLFLLHGAETRFTLTLEQSCNFSMRDKCTKMLLMTGHWGPEKDQIHTPIYIDKNEHGGILELAKHQNWSVSLEELTYFWFAPHAHSFRKVFELNKDKDDVPIESLKDLRRELGLDPSCWQSQIWGEPKPLFQCRWEGESQILIRPDYDITSVDTTYSVSTWSNSGTSLSD